MSDNFSQPYGYPIGALPFRKAYANGTATLGEDWTFDQDYYTAVLAGADYTFNPGGTPGPLEYLLSITPVGGPSEVTIFHWTTDADPTTGPWYAHWRGYVPVFNLDVVSISMSDSGEESQAAACFWGYLVPEIRPLI